MSSYRSLWDEGFNEIHIVSNAIVFGILDEKDEIEQQLTIKRDGYARIQRFTFGNGCKPYSVIEDKKISLPIETMKKIFDYIGYYLQAEHEYMFVTDVGYWEINLISQNKSSIPFTGPLFFNDIRYYEGHNICDIIRDLLDVSDLYLFDGNPDRLDELTINYERETRTYFRDEGWDFSKGEPFQSNHHKEQFQLFRNTNQLIYTIWHSDGCKTQQILEMNPLVLDILNSLGATAFIDKREPTILVDEPANENMKITYWIETHSKKGVTYVCEDSFDRYHLPIDWWKFIDTYLEDLESYILLGEMFQEKYYEREVRLASDRRFALIKFSEHGQTYAYLCNDENINTGDWVLVPVGAYGHTNRGLVTAIEYHQVEKAPYPMDKIKSVIKRLDLEDKNDFEY